ncbi:MAG: ABC transporter ATP-binding protein [candidate division WOR-3 bacterium]
MAKGKTGGLKLVYDFWRRHIPLAVLLVVLTAFASAVAVAFPYLLRLIIDGIKSEITSRKLLTYVLILSGFGLARTVADVLLPFIRGRTNERFQWEVRSGIFSRLLYFDYRFTNRFPSGDVMERLDHDLQELSWFACSGIFRFVAGALLALFTLVMLLRMNWLLTLVTVVPVSLGVFGWLRLGPKIYSLFMRWREQIAEINNQLQSAFAGIRLVKAFVTAGGLAYRFKETLDRRVGLAVRETRFEARLQVLYMAIAELALLLVLWVGGGLVIARRLTLGEFVAFNVYQLMLLPTMFDIGNLFVTGRRARGAEERIRELVSEDFSVRRGAAELKPVPGELRLERVTFSYEQVPVVRNVSMIIPPGRKIGIAGTVGSGKSTLLRLILRLMEPDAGTVKLNSTDIRELNLTAYRQLFGYAPQEPVLFSDTLRNNILFGRQADEARLWELLQLVQLEGDVREFVQGLDEPLGERGTGLSGGQKVRVALARALLLQPEIIILDDATSGLDADTEQEFFARLFTALPGRTFIIVSHRLKVLSACDYIYVLDQGEVSEQGTPAELLSRSGLYYRLYERQLLREELERLDS